MEKARVPGSGVAVAVIVAGWLVLAWPWLSGSVTIPYDAKAHFWPQLEFLARALHSGQSPFWAPGVFGGSPQIADPQSLIFSPAVILAALDPAPSFRAFDIYVLVLLLAAALAVAMLFRERGWHPAGAVVAALAFSFGASAAWRIQHVKQIQSLVFLAIALWLLTRVLRRGRYVDAVLCGLVGGLLIVEPGQVAMLGCYVLLGYVAYEWLSSDARGVVFRRSVAPLAVAAAVAAAIAIVPVLMSAAFVEASSRATIEYAAAGLGSLHPASLLTFLIGDLYSAGSVHAAYWGPPSGAWPAGGLSLASNMTEIYCGALVATALLLIGVARGALWRRDVRFFALTGLTAVVYALGHHTPAFQFIYDHVPAIHLFRRPADATFIIGAALALAGGYLVHLAVTEGVRATPRQALFATALIIGGFVAGIAVALAAGHLADAVRPLLISAALALASVAVLLNLKRMAALSPSLAIAVVALLSVVDLGVVNGPNGSTGLPPQQYAMLDTAAREPTIAFMMSHLAEPSSADRRDRIEMAGLGFEWPNAGLVHGFDHVLGYNPLRLAAVTKAVGADDTVATPGQRRFTPLFPSYRSRLADLLGLRYIATGVEVERIDHSLRPGDLDFVARTPSAYIYENRHAMPRVLFTAEWMPADFSDVTRTGRWPSFDPLRTVLLDVPSHAESLPAGSSMHPPSQVGLAAYGNAVVEIDVVAAESGFVVLNDIWHPWWRATVDGLPVPIFKANVLFRAVEVDKGRHRVRFAFEPFAGGWAQLTGRFQSPASPIPRHPPRTPDVPIAAAHGAGGMQGIGPNVRRP
jgi:hypothetical protein